MGKSNNGDVTDLKEDFHDIKVLLKKVNNGPTFSTVTDSMSLIAQPSTSLSANKNSISSARRRESTNKQPRNTDKVPSGMNDVQRNKTNDILNKSGSDVESRVSDHSDWTLVQ